MWNAVLCDDSNPLNYYITLHLHTYSTHQNAGSSKHCSNPSPFDTSKNFSTVQTSFSPKLTGSLAARFTPIKATAVTYDTNIVDYNSEISVFPAEACETIGGDACLADIYPEVRLQPEARNNTARTASENADREYLQYTDAKTVFLAEACDDLGGIFCEREYQRGVY